MTLNLLTRQLLNHNKLLLKDNKHNLYLDDLDMLTKIFQGMKEGGILILSEKIHFDNNLRNQKIYRMYDRFKLKNGYSEMEISAKRDSLEGVLVTDLEFFHEQRLNRIGFKNIRKVMSNLNFITLVAER